MTTQHRNVRQGGAKTSGVATRILLGLLIVAASLLVLAVGWAVGTGAAAATLSIAMSGGALVLALVSSRARRGHAAKTSSELTIVSERLLRLEARAVDAQARAPGQEIADDVALLGRLVSGLAETVSGQDAAITALRSAAAAAPRDEPAAPAVPGALTTRDDFARAATTIMDRLVRERSAAAPDPRTPEPRAPVLNAVEVTSRDRPAAAPASRPEERPVLEAVAAGDFELFVQPIVTLPQRRTRIYDTQARLRVGERVLELADFLPVLERHGCRPHLDLALVDRAGLVARHLAGRGSPAAVAIPLGSGSLLDPVIVARLGRLVAPAPETAKRVAITLSQRAFRSLSLDPDGPVAALRAAGVRFVLDELRELRQDWEEVARRGVGFVRMEAELLLHPDRRQEMMAFREALDRAGIELVASGVDEERRVPELLDDSVPLAYGAALAPPRFVRSDLGEPTRPSAPVAEQAAAQKVVAPAKPDAVPLREFLRQTG